MKTYTICGSMRFEKEMREIAYDLEARRGYAVVQCVYCEEGVTPTQEELKWLAAAHLRIIDISDGVYVVNIGGYIGDAVKREIECAKKRGKEVVYHCK